MNNDKLKFDSDFKSLKKIKTFDVKFIENVGFAPFIIVNYEKLSPQTPDIYFSLVQSEMDKFGIIHAFTDKFILDIFGENTKKYRLSDYKFHYLTFNQNGKILEKSSI